MLRPDPFFLYKLNGYHIYLSALAIGIIFYSLFFFFWNDLPSPVHVMLILYALLSFLALYINRPVKKINDKYFILRPFFWVPINLNEIVLIKSYEGAAIVKFNNAHLIKYRFIFVGNREDDIISELIHDLHLQLEDQSTLKQKVVPNNNASKSINKKIYKYLVLIVSILTLLFSIFIAKNIITANQIDELWYIQLVALLIASIIGIWTYSRLQ